MTDDSWHQLITYAGDMAQREYRQFERAQSKEDKARSMARYSVWKNFVQLLTELVIEDGEGDK